MLDTFSSEFVLVRDSFIEKTCLHRCVKSLALVAFLSACLAIAAMGGQRRQSLHGHAVLTVARKNCFSYGWLFVKSCSFKTNLMHPTL